MNLHEDENYNREFQIPMKNDAEPIKLIFEEREENIDCLKSWLVDQ